MNYPKQSQCTQFFQRGLNFYILPFKTAVICNKQADRESFRSIFAVKVRLIGNDRHNFKLFYLKNTETPFERLTHVQIHSIF